MFEFHGWATIRDRGSWESDEQAMFVDDPDPETVGKIRTLMGAFDGVSNHVTDLRQANGEWHLWIAGSHNHCDQRVVEFFGAVARSALGSYGVLYVYDDEAGSNANSWVPWVMKRGQVRAEQDTFLSPHIGTVEDEWAPT
jgi:hypothetical protein